MLHFTAFLTISSACWRFLTISHRNIQDKMWLLIYISSNIWSIYSISKQTQKLIFNLSQNPEHVLEPTKRQLRYTTVNLKNKYIQNKNKMSFNVHFFLYGRIRNQVKHLKRKRLLYICPPVQVKMLKYKLHY